MKEKTKHTRLQRQAVDSKQVMVAQDPSNEHAWEGNEDSNSKDNHADQLVKQNVSKTSKLTTKEEGVPEQGTTTSGGRGFHKSASSPSSC